MTPHPGRTCYQLCDEIVRAYVRDHAIRLDETLAWFRQMSSIEEAIQHWFRNSPVGIVDGHQRQRSKECRKLSALALNYKKRISAVASFDELCALARDICIENNLNLQQINQYDFSLRVGAFLGHSPTTVYLHRGALEGGRKAIEIETWRKTQGFRYLSQVHAIRHCRQMYDQECDVSCHIYPIEFRRLTPAHIESLSCIYRCCLENTRSAMVPTTI